MNKARISAALDWSCEWRQWNRISRKRTALLWKACAFNIRVSIKLGHVPFGRKLIEAKKQSLHLKRIVKIQWLSVMQSSETWRWRGLKGLYKDQCITEVQSAYKWWGTTWGQLISNPINSSMRRVGYCQDKRKHHCFRHLKTIKE